MIEFNAMFPVMVVEDLEVMKNFYQQVFGFAVVFYEPGFYLHLLSVDTGVQLGFLLPEHASQPDFLQKNMHKDGFVISLEVKDAAQAYAQAKALDLPFLLDLKTEIWGQKHFIVQDPMGFGIDLVQQIEASPK